MYRLLPSNRVHTNISVGIDQYHYYEVDMQALCLDIGYFLYINWLDRLIGLRYCRVTHDLKAFAPFWNLG